MRAAALAAADFCNVVITLPRDEVREGQAVDACADDPAAAEVNATVHSAPKNPKLDRIGRTSGPSHFGRRTTSLGFDTIVNAKKNKRGHSTLLVACGGLS